MGKSLYDSVSVAKEQLDRADSAFDGGLLRILWGEDAQALTSTAVAQPAILAVSVAAWCAVQDRVASPGAPLELDCVMGHSLGEYSALVAAGALSLEDAVRAVRLRGELMQNAVPAGNGAMAAVMGLDAETVENCIADLRSQGAEVGIAAFNSPQQITISGDTDGVDRGIAALNSLGARRAKRLKVSAPFHCSLMASVEAPLRDFLDGLDWQPFRMPVVANVNAQPYSDRATAIERLIAQLTQPVLWWQTLLELKQQGKRIWLEAGAGKTLVGFVKRAFVADAADDLLFSVGDAESLGNFVTYVIGSNPTPRV